MLLAVKLYNTCHWKCFCDFRWIDNAQNNYQQKMANHHVNFSFEKTKDQSIIEHYVKTVAIS